MTSLEQDLEAARISHEQGRAGDAAVHYRAALAKDPRNHVALHMLGIIAFQAGNAERALSLIEASLAAKSDVSTAWFNRSLILRVLGRRHDALYSARQALDLSADYPEAWGMAGLMLRELGDPLRARECHALALALRPNDPELKNDYAIDLLSLNDLVGAFQAMTEVLKAHKDFNPITMANILKAAGYPERALPFIRRTAELLPDQKEVILNEASALLQMGEYEKAWSLWEQRPDFDRSLAEIPFWNGSFVDHLLLYEDQGMGDAIQTVRYISQIEGLVGKITLRVAPPLKILFQQNFPRITVQSASEGVASADARMRLMSLPAFFRVTVPGIASTGPYLKAASAQCVKARDALGSVLRPRIGLVWGGNPANLTDAKRSIPSSFLYPLLEAGAGHIVSLQKGPHAEALDTSQAKMLDASAFLEDFSDTAAWMAELDLIITTCTSTAHLAGALGRPTWLLLSFDPHWVWLLGTTKSPWYPSLSLYRQQTPGDWKTLINQVAHDLADMINGRKPIHKSRSDFDRPARQNPLAVKLPFE